MNEVKGPHLASTPAKMSDLSLARGSSTAPHVPAMSDRDDLASRPACASLSAQSRASQQPRRAAARAPACPQILKRNETGETGCTWKGEGFMGKCPHVFVSQLFCKLGTTRSHCGPENYMLHFFSRHLSVFTCSTPHSCPSLHAHLGNSCTTTTPHSKVPTSHFHLGRPRVHLRDRLG